jgi:hypothetical protein
MGNCSSNSLSEIYGYTFTTQNYEAVKRFLPMLEEKSYWFASSVDWRTENSVRNSKLTPPYDLYHFNVTVCIHSEQLPTPEERKNFYDQLNIVVLEAGFVQVDGTLQPFNFLIRNKVQAPIELDTNRRMIAGYKKQIAHSTANKVLKFDTKVLPEIVCQYIQYDEDMLIGRV